jgi:hypothetical protein
MAAQVARAPHPVQGKAAQKITAAFRVALPLKFRRK